MSFLSFKEALIRLVSHRGPKNQAVLREMVEGLFPSHVKQEVRKIYAEAYEVNGTTVILSRLGCQSAKCILVDYETGQWLCPDAE